MLAAAAQEGGEMAEVGVEPVMGGRVEAPKV
jgi:hypothetical protein